MYCRWIAYASRLVFVLYIQCINSLRFPAQSKTKRHYFEYLTFSCHSAMRRLQSIRRRRQSHVVQGRLNFHEFGTKTEAEAFVIKNVDIKKLKHGITMKNIAVILGVVLSSSAAFASELQNIECGGTRRTQESRLRTLVQPQSHLCDAQGKRQSTDSTDLVHDEAWSPLCAPFQTVHVLSQYSTDRMIERIPPSPH